MNNTTTNNNVLLYIIFFGIGYFSFHIGMNLIRIFPFIVTLTGFYGFCVSNMLIFSFLFVLGLYIFKIRNFEFVLKTFICSILFSFLILICFYIAILVYNDISEISVIILLGIPLLLIISFVINFQYFKEEPLINFTVKVFTISIIGFILSFIFCAMQVYTKY